MSNWLWFVKSVIEVNGRKRKGEKKSKSWLVGWQISALKNREPTESINLNKETEGSCSNRSENSSDIKLDISRTPAIDRDSPLSSHPTASRSLFPTSIRSTGGMTTTQLFHNSTRPDLQCQKMDHSTVKEESLCNMFGIDDQAGFWPWLEQQHFNWEPKYYDHIHWLAPCMLFMIFQFLFSYLDWCKVKR